LILCTVKPVNIFLFRYPTLSRATMPWRAGLSTTIKELRFMLNPRVPQSDGCR